MGPGLRHPVQAGRGRHQPAAGGAHHAAHVDQHPGQLRAHPGAGEGVHDLLPHPRGGHAGRVPGARPLPLLRLLGSGPRADVPHHRHLGRAQPHLRHHQVRPLHAGRLAAHAGGHPGHRLRLRGRPRWRLHGRFRLRAAARLPLLGRPPDRGLPGLLPGLRHQGAHGALPHVAARCPRGGPHGRLGDPGRRPAQAGGLRLHPLLAAPLPARGAVVRGADRRPVTDRHHLRRHRGPRPDRPQETHRLLVGEPHGLRDPGHLHLPAAGPSGRRAPDGQSRAHHRRPLPAGGGHLRTRP